MKLFLLSLIFLTSLVSCKKDKADGMGDSPNCTEAPLQSWDTLNCDQSLPWSNTSLYDLMGSRFEVTTNHIPDHDVGSFPNPSNPNSIIHMEDTFYVPGLPTMSSSSLSILNPDGTKAYMFGLSVDAILFDPVAHRPFAQGSANQNDLWDRNALHADLGLDCSFGNVRTTGLYHYMGEPRKLFEQLSGTDSTMTLLGYSADGFPIYAKYGYDAATDDDSPVRELTSSYQLKSGERPGDGESAPCGNYDGKYVRDFEFIAGSGDLDECNGRWGVTPEFPTGTYYYVITRDFPFIPRCFMGTPDASFGI